jgi:hypothetical protein
VIRSSSRVLCLSILGLSACHARPYDLAWPCVTSVRDEYRDFHVGERRARFQSLDVSFAFHFDVWLDATSVAHHAIRREKDGRFEAVGDSDYLHAPDEQPGRKAPASPVAAPPVVPDEALAEMLANVYRTYVTFAKVRYADRLVAAGCPTAPDRACLARAAALDGIVIDYVGGYRKLMLDVFEASRIEPEGLPYGRTTRYIVPMSEDLASVVGPITVAGTYTRQVCDPGCGGCAGAPRWVRQPIDTSEPLSQALIVAVLAAGRL